MRLTSILLMVDVEMRIVQVSWGVYSFFGKSDMSQAIALVIGGAIHGPGGGGSFTERLGHAEVGAAIAATSDCGTSSPIGMTGRPMAIWEMSAERSGS